MTQIIATDRDNIAIHGLGATADEARRDALDNAGPLFDAEGNDLPEGEAMAQFVTRPATPALYARVKDHGGAIAWGSLPDGRACTREEEEAVREAQE